VKDLVTYFDRCEQVATIDNRKDVENEAQGTPILVCHGLRRDWHQTWTRMRFLS